jgi:hypothetical protein
MPANRFENGPVSEVTLQTGAQDENALNESAAAENSSATTEPQVSNMIAEGGPALPEGIIPATDRPRGAGNSTGGKYQRGRGRRHERTLGYRAGTRH